MSHHPEEDRPDERRGLQRLLDGPELARIAPHLAPEVLHRLIRHAGLERCASLVESWSREQLTAVLDLDLWRAPAPGAAEELDPDRFGEWLEALVGHDATTAARVMARCERALVVRGLAHFIRVLDPGVLEPTESTDDERREDVLFVAEGLTAEVGGYMVQARREGAWDAILELLVELSAGDAECFRALMDGCRDVSDDGRELDGLDDLLEAPDQLFHDVHVARDDRREERGFSTAADARAFLGPARQPRLAAGTNAVAAAWLRRGDGGNPLRPPAGRLAAPVDPVVASALEEVTRVLAAEGVLPELPRALLGRGNAGDREPGGLPPFMEYVLERHPDVGLTRGREMAFLANTLVAGCGFQSRSFTPAEASRAVVATCSLGLLRQPAPPDIDHIVGHDLIGLFQDGWAALHREVSMFVAEGLIDILREVQSGESDVILGLHTLRQSLETHVSAGAPWLARDAVQGLAMLDTPACVGLQGLLGECPVLSDVLTAIVERRTGRIDPNAFAFISTNADIDTVRAFMGRLPDLLSG